MTFFKRFSGLGFKVEFRCLPYTEEIIFNIFPECLLIVFEHKNIIRSRI